MIDRTTALASAALIAFMLVAAAWRIIMLDDWTTLLFQNEAPATALLLVWSIGSRLHLSRKWKLEQLEARWAKP